MRIGVITDRLRINYGGILQAYALQRVLHDMGHEAHYIDWRPYKFQLHSFKTYFMRLLWKIKLLGRQNVAVLYDPEFIYNQAFRRINRFAEANIRIYPIRSFAQLRETDFDAYIVGSDQIWRPTYVPIGADAYLHFARHWSVRRIAYAASFGVDHLGEYSPEQLAQCATLAQQFHAISVREDSGVALCRTHFGVEATHVLDPTMLVDPRHYLSHIRRCRKHYPKNMCLSYVLDATPAKAQVLESILAHSHYESVKWEDIYGFKSNPTVEEWLKGFHEAQFIFTDSFHGCVFAILFGKPFIAFGNAGRGTTRFTSLLRQFGLEEFLIRSADEFSPDLVHRAIARFSDDAIQERLNELRKSSYEFLEKALQDKNIVK